MQIVGVFRELEPSATALPSIHEHTYQLSQSEAVAVARYLESGTPIFDVMEATRDPLSPGNFVPGGASLVSDGTYVWRNDLAYFVSNYKVRVPPQLVLRELEGPNTGRNESTLITDWKGALDEYEGHLRRHSV